MNLARQRRPVHLLLPYTLLSVLALAACSDGPTSPPGPAAVALDADSLVLAAGAEDTLHATLVTAAGDPFASTTAVEWSSSNEDVATVDAEGVVRADSSGTATITARIDTFSVSIGVRVFSELAELRLATPITTIGFRDSVQLAVTAHDGAGNLMPGDGLTWATSDPAVVAVDESGFVRARGWGAAQIVASLDGVALSIPITTTVTQVTTPADFDWIAVSWEHGCGLTAGGEAWCWGGNSDGQLGDGTRNTSSTAPPRLGPFVRVLGEHAFTSIDVGQQSTCAIDDQKALWCWGTNARGQLGLDSITAANRTQLAPVLVVGGHQWKHVELGQHATTCAIRSDDVLHCWGHNDFWQAGRFNTSGSRADGRSDDPRVLPIDGSFEALDVSLDVLGGCFVTTAGAPYCWGHGPYVLPSAITGHVPEAIAGTPALRSVVHAGTAGCGLSAAGEVWCWGRNYDGVFPGAAVDDIWHDATRIAGLPPLVRLEGQSGGFCGLTATAELWCWGNVYIRPAPGVGAIAAAPRRWGPPGLVFRDISVSNLGQFWDGCALTTDSKLYCW